MSVRGFTPGDVEPARDALVACGSFTAEEVRVAVEMIEAGLAGEYRLLAVTTERITEDRIFAGYACAGPAPLTQRSWYLYWICLAPAAMGTSAARRLLAGVEAAIRADGGNRLVVETSGRDSYARARSFYRSAGFQECGRIPDFFAAGDDCILYCKALDA